MILYFADRQLSIIGQASTNLSRGLTFSDDCISEDVETGVAVFECNVAFHDETRADVERCTDVGNYILMQYQDENKLFTIIDAELDTEAQQVYIYAEDGGMDLLNEVFGAYEADKDYPISHYMTMYAGKAGFVIGSNEAASLSRKLSWDGEATAAERVASVATQFDGCEVSYSFAIEGLAVTQKYINIYKKRGKDIGTPLVLNRDVGKIVISKSIGNLATALKCTGGTPEGKEEPITLNGYKYDDGDFYVDGDTLKSRNALSRWNRYLWKNEQSEQAGGHIVRPYTYDTPEQKTLCSHAITELKKIRDVAVNYEAEITKFPDGTKIGDRITIVDDKGGLYLSTRILKLETCISEDTHKATLGEFLIKGSGISAMVKDLAEKFASSANAIPVARKALATAENAKTAAATAQASADAAQLSADEANKGVKDLQDQIGQATAAASLADQKIDDIESRIYTLNVSLKNANDAAANAKTAADTAQKKAEEAAQAAANAKLDAAAVNEAVIIAEEKAVTATEKAETAQTTATAADAEAKAAKATADAAKLDAEKANADIANMGKELDTVSQTMAAEYARKTDLTESEASLETKISQNAAEISTTAKKVATVDETANTAKEQAETAQKTAATAKTQADQATADAVAAKTAADGAAAAAASAQNEANTAKAAAETAKNVANKAETDLAAAKADLATVATRVDATEAEIATAQGAVQAAQTVADKAKADATAAAEKAIAAQSKADAAVLDATNAQATANDAASKAAIAQKLASEASGDASAAINTANQAATVASEAQTMANTAKNTADNAQAAADQAVTNATAAQTAANAASDKANKAAVDLDAAKKNLADVVLRVDSTVADVEAAKEAVATAQAAADKAKADAVAAQTTADTAKANAAKAQTAASTAKTAADAAQAAADAAKLAADDAKAAADSLAVRVTTAETKIKQTTEEIALMAKKTDVAEMLGGYSTKQETEAAIKLESDSIFSKVSSTHATKTALSDVDETAKDAQSTAGAATERVSVAESTIQQIADAIAMLITDDSGASLMTQTENGWTFNMAQISQTLDAATTDINALSESLGGVDSLIKALQQSVGDLGILTDYVIVTTYKNKPCIELGESENQFKLRITNTEIQFVDGTAIPAYITNKKLMIEQAEVKDELQFGGFVWKTRSNGNMGLMWKGVGS